MADLGGRLPTENDSAQRFVQAAPRGPSFLEQLADFGSGVVGVADKLATSLEQNKAKDRAAADMAAKNDAVRRVAGGLFSDPSMAPTIPPESQGAYDSSKPLAQTAANAQTAATQGKLDPAMAQAKSLAIFRQALAKNPGHEFAVFQAFKEMGVDNMMMQQYKNAETAIESDQSAQQATTHKLEDTAVNKYGYVDFYKKSPSEQATILATVGNLEAQSADLDAKTKLASLTMQQNTLTRDEQTDVQKTNSQSLLSSATTYMTGSFGNLSKMMINQLGDPTLQAQPGRLEGLQSHLMNVALPALDTQYNLKMAQVLPYLTPEDRSTLQETYKTQRQALVDMISGPQSVVEMNKRVLENLSTNFGIQYEKAAPMLMNLQKMIGPQAVGVLLSPSIQGNPALMTMLKNELNAVTRDPSKMPSFTEFVQSLNGTVDPATWDPEKMRAAAPAALVSMNALGHDSASSNGTDKQGHVALLNSIKQTSGVAVDVVPQWGFANVLMQGKALNTRGVTTAMFHTGSINQPDKIDAVHAWIPAATRTYATLSQLNAGDNYYSVKLDPHTLQWSAVWNGKMAVRSATGADVSGLPAGKLVAMGINPNGGVKPAPSSKVLEQAATLNVMLNNLSHSAASGWDDSLGKGVNYQEARRFFATGELPQSLKNPTSKSKNGKTPEQNVDDTISHMLDFVNKLPNPSEPTASTKAGKIGPSPLAPVIGASAAKYGVPPAIAASLFHTETRGGKDHRVSDKGAMGPGQIMPATAAAYGKDVTKLSDEDNIDLALHILSDNYKKTGNWADALSMYHSGHDLKTATAHNMTDGHMRTSDYVASTMAAASSISPENLQRYGYVRF